MKKYYIRRNDEEKGPCTVPEILRSGLDRTDMLWNEESGEWKLAIDTDEFKEYFSTFQEQAENISNNTGQRQVLMDKVNNINLKKSKYFSLLIGSMVIIMLLLTYYFLTQLF